MINRVREAQEATPEACVARQPDQSLQVGVKAPAPAMWQASSVRVPPVLGSPAGVLRIQQLKGNRAMSRMLSVQQSAEAQGLRGQSDETMRSVAAEGVRTPETSLSYLDRIQASFGRHSIGHVKAHVGPEAAQASRAMNALAFASGDHVVFGGTPDLRAMAHEAAHTVQQQAGVQLVGGIGREDDAYERHADAVADAVVTGRPADGLLRGLFTASPVPESSAKSANVHRKLAGSVEVQRLEENILNVAGENHDISGGREDDERAFSDAQTKSGRYWKESDFEAADLETRADSPELRFQRRLLFALQEFSHPDFYTLEGFYLSKFRDGNYRSLLLIYAAARKFLPSDAEQEYKHASTLRKYDAVIPSLLGLLKIARSSILYNHNERLKIARESTVLNPPTQVIEGLIRDIKNIKSALRALLFAVFELDREDSLEGLGKSLDFQRSENMYVAAKSRFHVSGLWKIGDAHVQDMKQKMEPTALFNLLTLKEFDGELQAWEGQGRPRRVHRVNEAVE